MNDSLAHLDTTLQTINDLLADPRTAVHAAEVLYQLSLSAGHAIRTHPSRVWDRCLGHLSTTINNPTCGLQERVAAGFVLGQLGDPRPGVSSLPFDWCHIPAGTYQVGEAEALATLPPFQLTSPMEAMNASRLQMATLPPFQISRYPVTNSQWRQFMEAGGYTTRQWWTREGWEVCQQGYVLGDFGYWVPSGHPWTQPRHWVDDHANGSNQPVVGISWYEAQAFCAWASHIHTGLIRLPTNTEWEIAARGPARLVYPWGNQWDATWTNTEEGQVNHATPVGCYPQGASWCGARDMIGNVIEWTSDGYDARDRSQQFLDPTIPRPMIFLRGSSWIEVSWASFCAHLEDAEPWTREDYIGFRCVHIP